MLSLPCSQPFAVSSTTKQSSTSFTTSSKPPTAKVTSAMAKSFHSTPTSAALPNQGTVTVTLTPPQKTSTATTPVPATTTQSPLLLCQSAKSLTESWRLYHVDDEEVDDECNHHHHHHYGCKHHKKKPKSKKKNDYFGKRSTCDIHPSMQWFKFSGNAGEDTNC